MVNRKKLGSLLTQLTFLNTFIIAAVILIAGFTVKNYACNLVNQQQITGASLESLLNDYLIKVSALAFLLAGGFHFFFIKWLTTPLKKLTEATQALKKGEYPEKLKKPLIYEVKELSEAFNDLSETTALVKTKQNRLLRDLSHELRTPLTNLTGYLEGLEKGIVEGDKEMYRSLQEETGRIERLLQQLVHINRWTADENLTAHHQDEILIHELLQSRITAFQLKFKEKEIDVTAELAPCSLKGNRDGLHQVFSNLLQNIADYDVGKKLFIKGFVADQQYAVQFSHDGKEIPKAEKDLIFERFYRVDSSRSFVTDGAGLGLAITKEIVQAHGGTLTLETDGHHHTFEVRLPAGQFKKEENDDESTMV
ncbi:cell wall metabolism sensor histidine kinase WalK [Bacillus sp. Marseille-Q1617]|uniref:sensor histidine kinase n=1 Tax=Bacillus sp. Marseille-Q1617 TaxID=2736887 RepID=UPI00158E2A2A|nr:HAMP domain-containing sensor histidine kinase [Bacillus sp. Marseille-Q1617]